MLKEGDSAPEFTLPDSYGKKVSLKDFKGKCVVLYFYPKDNTSGCTIEARDFTKLKGEFEKLNAIVLGVSNDSCESHVKFTNDKSLGITLLADTETEVLKKYGAWRLKNMLGKEYMGTVRSTFLIDEKGKIAKIWDSVNPLGHADAVLKKIRA
jgi:peroxiredoxin Q/BCP